MSRPLRPALAVLALVAAVPAAPAAAASYEQISRASGAAGASVLGFRSSPLFASDGGVLGASTSPQGAEAAGYPTTALRNTVTNRTRLVHPEAGELLGVDRAETTGLFRRIDLADGATVFSVLRLYSADPPQLVVRVPPTDPAGAMLTGDGRSLLVTDGAGLKRYPVRGGAPEVVSATNVIPPPRFAASDDGSVVGASAYDEAAGGSVGVVLSGGTRTVVGGWPWVAPDGRTVSWLGGPAGDQTKPALYTRTLATGRTTSVPLPADVDESFLIAWVSPDGGRVAVADSGVGGDEHVLAKARVLDRATGRWSAFGGVYAGSISSGYQASAISRNGRYAAIAFNGQVALVNLSGHALAGNLDGADVLSAAAYLRAPQGYAWFGCGDGSFVDGHFVRPAAWLPAPRRLRAVVKADGVTALDQTLTQPGSATGPLDGDGFLHRFAPGTQTASLTVSVVDGQGHTVTDTITKRVACAG